MERIYFPITCNILTPGHIQSLQYLAERGQVVAGLLNSKALKGYKREVVPFEDRKCILETVAKAVRNVEVVEQDSLDPTVNCRRYNCTAIASGDGFEIEELNAIGELALKPILIKLPGETEKKYSSSKILNATISNKR